MRSWSAVVVVVVAGFSSLSCSDEDTGPDVGPDVSWQLGCAEDDSGGCGTSEDAHGPIGGADDELKTDDEPIVVKSCRFTAAGMQLELEQPEIKADTVKKIKARALSIVKVTNAKAEDNKCYVEVTEYPRDNSPRQLRVTDTCKGNVGSSREGTCELTGERNSEGYGFNGTIKCDGMRAGGAGDPDYQLGAARAIREPMKLQILDCG